MVNVEAPVVTCKKVEVLVEEEVVTSIDVDVLVGLLDAPVSGAGLTAELDVTVGAVLVNVTTTEEVGVSIVVEVEVMGVESAVSVIG